MSKEKEEDKVRFSDFHTSLKIGFMMSAIGGTILTLILISAIIHYVLSGIFSIY